MLPLFEHFLETVPTVPDSEYPACCIVSLSYSFVAGTCFTRLLYQPTVLAAAPPLWHYAGILVFGMCSCWHTDTAMGDNQLRERRRAYYERSAFSCIPRCASGNACNVTDPPSTLSCSRRPLPALTSASKCMVWVHRLPMTFSALPLHRL
ncbi:hypothetical protein Leryth_020017 [Lithospermum erythrorhizon]|nr:hypothetical protein Leryth_020017 [Lithospermum erythrorhizon]